MPALPPAFLKGIICIMSDEKAALDVRICVASRFRTRWVTAGGRIIRQCSPAEVDAADSMALTTVVPLEDVQRVAHGQAKPEAVAAIRSEPKRLEVVDRPDDFEVGD